MRTTVPPYRTDLTTPFVEPKRHSHENQPHIVPRWDPGRRTGGSLVHRTTHDAGSGTACARSPSAPFVAGTGRPASLDSPTGPATPRTRNAAARTRQTPETRQEKGSEAPPRSAPRQSCLGAADVVALLPNKPKAGKHVACRPSPYHDLPEALRVRTGRTLLAGLLDEILHAGQHLFAHIRPREHQIVQSAANLGQRHIAA